jgi:hypothetical protein
MNTVNVQILLDIMPSSTIKQRRRWEVICDGALNYVELGYANCRQSSNYKPCLATPLTLHYSMAKASYRVSSVNDLYWPKRLLPEVTFQHLHMLLIPLK